MQRHRAVPRSRSSGSLRLDSRLWTWTHGRARSRRSTPAGWKEHGPAANATMVDHTNVLLLRAVWPRGRVSLRSAPTASAGASDTPGGIMVATIAHLAGPASPAIAGSRRAGGGPRAAGPARHGAGSEAVRAPTSPRRRERGVTVVTCATADAIGPPRAPTRSRRPGRAPDRVTRGASAARAYPPFVPPSPHGARLHRGLVHGRRGAHGTGAASGAREADRSRRPGEGAQQPRSRAQ